MNYIKNLFYRIDSNINDDTNIINDASNIKIDIDDTNIINDDTNIKIDIDDNDNFNIIDASNIKIDIDDNDNFNIIGDKFNGIDDKFKTNISTPTTSDKFSIKDIIHKPCSLNDDFFISEPSDSSISDEYNKDIMKSCFIKILLYKNFIGYENKYI